MGAEKVLTVCYWLSCNSSCCSTEQWRPTGMPAKASGSVTLQPLSTPRMPGDEQEQKAKQRHKEYEKKREAKNRDRQMYILRHTRDYEALELPIGASRAEVKAQYRKLAKARQIYA